MSRVSKLKQHAKSVLPHGSQIQRPDYLPKVHNGRLAGVADASSTSTNDEHKRPPRLAQRQCRLAVTAKAIAREVATTRRVCYGIGSIARLAADIVLYRALRLGWLPGENNPRRIHLRTGNQISYRLNRGDIQSIREVFMDEVYRLPFDLRPRVIVDLGANIGLTGVYLSRRFQPDVLVAVEPDHGNACLARKNLGPLGACVVEAAIGPRDGVAQFEPNRDSNLGSLGPAASVEVSMISMPTLLSMTGISVIDLLKMDIEGGEEALLTGNIDWLTRVKAIIAEFHPNVVDYPELVRLLVHSGFHYVAAGALWPGSMDAFLREETRAS